MAVLDHLAILYVLTTDLSKRTGCIVDELGDNGKLRVSIDASGTRPKKGFVAHTPAVEVTARLVANAVAVDAVSAAVQLIDIARMWGECSRVFVRLPDVHLLATGAVLALSGVGIVR